MSREYREHLERVENWVKALNKAGHYINQVIEEMDDHMNGWDSPPGNEPFAVASQIFYEAGKVTGQLETALNLVLDVHEGFVDFKKLHKDAINKAAASLEVVK